MEKSGWRLIAILFITFFIFGIVLSVWLYSWGVDMVDKEYECAYNVCGDPEISYYQYYDYEEVCECYDSDMNLIKLEYLG